VIFGIAYPPKVALFKIGCILAEKFEKFRASQQPKALVVVIKMGGLRMVSHSWGKRRVVCHTPANFHLLIPAHSHELQ